MQKNKAKEEIVSGEKHILFSQPSTLYPVPNIPTSEFSFYITSFDESPETISRLMFELKQVKPDDTTRIYINSDGGLINEGKALINSLDETGAEIVTYLSSRGYSMGSMLFCLGETRVVYEHSSIMFHNYAAGSYGKGHELKDHVNFMNDSLESFFRTYSIGLSDAEIQNMFDGKEFWFDTKEMCKRGIATHVSVDGMLISAEDYLKLLKKTVKAGKKKDIVIPSLIGALKYDIDFVSEYMTAKAVEQVEIHNQIIALSSQLK